MPPIQGALISMVLMILIGGVFLMFPPLWIVFIIYIIHRIRKKFF